jgi:predicted phosphodiesterase
MSSASATAATTPADGTSAVLAVLSDIHGNRWALEAVLRDIDSRGVESIINLGDHLTGPLDPSGTADILLAREMLSICGNDDRVLFAPTETLSPSQRFTRDQLSERQISWLRALPDTAIVSDDIFACHGDLFAAPYLLEQVEDSGSVVLRGSAEIEASVAAIAQPVILSGHSHQPRTVYLPSGTLLVNPGSVGLPAYTMEAPVEAPVAYGMESGSPHARYAVLSKLPHGWQVDHVQVPYDWEHAASVARDHRRPDWAQWLASGRAR